MRLDAGELFERYHGVVFRRCLALLRNEEDAAEAVQEVFCVAVRGLGRFRLRSAPLTWLYAIATRRCLQQLRNRSSRMLKEALFLSEPSSTSPDPSARADLDRLLSGLSPEELALFAYAFRDGFTQEELAELLRVSRKTVGKRLKALNARLGRWTAGAAPREAALRAAEEVAG
ncbi:MAG: sigma-70 family RNA polymerase sigma factor [Myxococcales bacterium]|nr:sigma-70 family RNA polymerase sigma factor [Myxococcales bacterium]